MTPQGDSGDPFCWQPPSPDAVSSEAPAALGELVIEPDPPRRGLRRPASVWAGGVALAALVAVLVVVLSGGSGGGGPIALAADVTAHEAGYQFTLQESVAAAGQTVNFTGSGRISTGPPIEGSMSFSVGSTTANEIFDGSNLYIQVPSVASTWTEVPLGSVLKSAGVSESSPESNDPAATLDLLRAAGSVDDDGPATIAGVATTHYHAVVDLATLISEEGAAANAYAKQLEHLIGGVTMPVDVWVDSANRVRQLTLAISASADGAPLTIALTMDLSDYGPQAAISPPPASDVTTAPGSSSPNAAPSSSSSTGSSTGAV